jgi:2-(1,2-epoxy-1,2-dihydrophenyl)acetyl-CoA isomerase
VSTLVDYQTLDLTIEDGLATLVLDRPDSLNALNLQMKEDLAEVLRVLADSAEVRAVLLTGAGRAFSSGGDIKEMDPERDPETVRRRLSKVTREIVIPLARLDKPVIGAVNGHAHGAGLALALACDILYAADSAVLSMAFARIGLGPDCAATFLLARAVGLSSAKEMMFTGRRLSAAEALELGLVSHVVPAEELMATAGAAAQQLASGPTVALAAAKRLLNEAAIHSIEDAAELEAFSQALAVNSDDHREGVAAFAEKREPRFRGC